MTTERWLDQWRRAQLLSADQHARLSAIARRERVSVHLELHALLYLGVVASAGLGWTVREHFTDLGDALIVVTLATLFTGSLAYCVRRSPPYSSERVGAPTFVFDYALYVGCLAFAVELGYVEYRFHLLEASWETYLLASAALYFALAYRFDNRFVLSLALSTLAGWFGVRLSSWDVLPSTMRGLAVLYGVVVAAIGLWTYQRRLKRHFLEAYLHVAANAALLGLASGAIMARLEWWWLPMLLAGSAAVVVLGIRYRQFAFVVYGVGYAYVGFSARVLDSMRDLEPILIYFVVSGIVVVGGLAVVARRFGRDA
jgi:hypothetical protein